MYFLVGHYSNHQQGCLGKNLCIVLILINFVTLFTVSLERDKLAKEIELYNLTLVSKYIPL